MHRWMLALFLALPVPLAQAGPAGPDNIVATFSIVARDPETGALGCAVQSRYFAVGAVVPWGEADVGIVATQANVNVGYGPQAVDLLRQGLSAEAVLEKIQAVDNFPGKDGRQVAIIDAEGGIAVYTGPTAMYWAGHKKGKDYSAQGNILTGPEVVDAMAAAFEKTEGSLAERLVAALEAGQEAGGDSRGRQSAALLVVQKGAGRNTNNDVQTRLHVDDHPTPIKELRRLLNIQLAMEAMRTSRELMSESQTSGALEAATRATELWPNTSDTHLNLGLIAYRGGNKDQALAAMRKAKEMNPLFKGQLEATISWTDSPPLDGAFMKKLFPESN